MRIDAYNSVNQVYQTNSKMVSKATSAQKVNDKFEISSTAKSFQAAKKAVNDAPDIREDKVAKIKAMMNAGTYTVSPSDFADKILGNQSTLIF